MNSFNPEMNNELTIQDVITSKIVELDDKKDIVDIAIKNVIVYPNRFDKKSIYIDIEIWVNKIGNSSFGLTYEMKNGDELLA